MKAMLEFNLPEEQEELNYALKGTQYSDQIDEIYNLVFRPYSSILKRRL